MSSIELHKRWFPRHFVNAAKVDRLVELRSAAVVALRNIIDAKRNLDAAVLEADGVVEQLDAAESAEPADAA